MTGKCRQCLFTLNKMVTGAVTLKMSRGSMVLAAILSCLKQGLAEQSHAKKFCLLMKLIR